MRDLGLKGEPPVFNAGGDDLLGDELETFLESLAHAYGSVTAADDLTLRRAAQDVQYRAEFVAQAAKRGDWGNALYHMFYLGHAEGQALLWAREASAIDTGRKVTNGAAGYWKATAGERASRNLAICAEVDRLLDENPGAKRQGEEGIYGKAGRRPDLGWNLGWDQVRDIYNERERNKSGAPQ